MSQQASAGTFTTLKSPALTLQGGGAGETPSGSDTRRLSARDRRLWRNPTERLPISPS